MLGTVAGLVALTALLGCYRGVRAAHAATAAKASLLRAETDLGASRLKETRADLGRAKAQFLRTRQEIRGLGPVLPVARTIPFVRIQVRGAERFADAGLLLSDAGLRLTDTAESIVAPADRDVQVADALEPLRRLQGSLDAGTRLLAAAADKVASLNGYRLIGPLGAARDELVRRIPRFEQRAASAQDGLSAMVAFAGGDGPRRYLFLSQNPAELRPTGGFIGTYGVIAARDGKVSLERYNSIESWIVPHPQASIAAEDAGSPFPYIFPPLRQTLANVNSVPDWPRVAQAATEMWRLGGEEPVDGVLSFSTGFLVRLLAVIGPTPIDSYGETVTADNVIQRIDFYVGQPVPNRKDFVAAVAEVLLRRLLDAPASTWQPLGTALGQGFGAREVLAWSKDEAVTRTLVERGWDGGLPSGPGDFFFDSHFAFATKNGRGINRDYDHDVTVHADGSAVVTTTITIKDTQPVTRLNTDTLGYITVYGPQGAALDDSSDPGALLEPSVAGHPAAAWFRAAPALGETTLKVAWKVPKLLERNRDGTWTYSLRWRRIPDHSGDVLHTRVHLPAGWRWTGSPPPETFPLTKDLTGAWYVNGA